jgi:aspartate-semialdehyde dehydrogenase
MKLALIGATGMVGRTMIQVIEERGLQLDQFYPVASEKSRGTEVFVHGKPYATITLDEAVEKDLDYVLFSAGGSISKEWAPKFAQKNAVVIDNSSAWRMDKDVPLVVPQINGHSITSANKIIANPNCSTIQLVMALAPLHKEYGVKRVVISTYQSVTGTGKAAVEQMEEERANKGVSVQKVYPHAIDKNCIPHCDIFVEDGYTKEEMKLVNETQKILADETIALTATAVRVPVVGGHSESVNVEFINDFDLESVTRVLNDTDGVKVKDNLDNFDYPTPLEAMGKDEVFVGRIRRDFSQENTLNMWIVSDNLRKGAATNAVEIVELLELQHASRIS